jgi:hypothetical protein
MQHASTTHGEAVLDYVVGILEEVTGNRDVEPISSATSLGDLDLASINLVYLIAEAQQSYGLGDRLFQRLQAAGIHVSQLRVRDLVGHVEALLAAGGAPAEGWPG